MEERKANEETKYEAEKVKAKGPLASSHAIFSAFGKTRKVSIFRTLGILFAMASGAVYPCMAFYFTKSFEGVGAQSSDENYLSNVRYMVFTILLVGSIGFFFLVLQSAFLEISASEATQDFKIQWFNALLRQDMAYFDINDISVQATYISSKALQFKKGIGRKLGEGVQFSCSFVGGFIYAFYVSWRVSLVILATIPFVTGAAFFMMTVTAKHTERIGNNYAATGGIVYSTISSIRTVFSLNAPNAFIEKFEASTKKACESAVSVNALLGLGNGSMTGSFLLSYIVVTLYGAFLLYSQVEKSGCDPSNTLKSASALDNVESCSTVGADVFGASIGISFGAMSLAQISNAVEAFIGTRASAYPALEAINRKFDPNDNGTLESVEAPLEVNTLNRSEIPLPKYEIDSTSNYGKKPKTIKGDIKFNNISFSYPTRREQLIFNGLSLSIKAGSTVAIVGSSGCGKSSIVSLLERFYDVNSGSITVDGIDIRDINVQWLREHIGLVSQEPVLFARTIKENISYGLPGATDEDIIRVCKSASAHEFISKFENGYDTQVGDKGTQLSGGQKQRIAIARVLLRNPKILLLDEATSALDSESEYLVQEAIDGLLGRRNHTTIIVAHRLSTIRNADVIAVLKDGHIAEMGTHDELMSRVESEYCKLVSAQTVDRDDKSHRDDTVSIAESLIMSDSENITTPQIEFNNVHFYYPTRPSNQIFKGLNLKIKHGETLAIVGPSGGGKSTVVQLIERFYDPNAGTISYEGHDLKDLNIKWYRDQIGLVSQEPTLFNTTIRENIMYGLPGATQDQIEEAARKANAHDFITSFPLGYDTEVGESATQISGGQKQRIAIARAILKEPKVLLLDEATSALDTESERIVQRAIDSLMESKSQTIVVIAHRLSTIQNADRIAVVAHGIVQEIGTHDQLLSIENGHYKRLVEFDNTSGSDKKLIIHNKMEAVEGDSLKDTSSSIAREEIEQDLKSKEKAYSIRAKRMSDPDRLYFLIGIIGAILSGLVSPGRGIAFGFMIELLFHPVFPCDEFNFMESDSFVGFQSCQDYFDHEADWIRDSSYKITYGWLGLIASSIIGNVLLYYGFGTASERMNKRVRDAMFVALMKQDIAFYDTHSVGSLSSHIEEDASMIYSFSGQPIRTFAISISSVVVGLIVSFSLMWPFALITLAVIPFLGFGSFMERKIYTGDEINLSSKEGTWTSSDSILIETLLDIRTVSSLGIERRRAEEYISALRHEEPSSIKMNLLKGFAVGAGFLAEFWSLGWMFFWGGFFISNYPNTYSFRSYLISMFSLFFSLFGLSAALMDTSDKTKAKKAADRIFSLLDRKCVIDSISDEGAKLVE